MIFASDLDQTLIFSERFLLDRTLPVRLIEQLEGKSISFMTERAILLLQEIHERMLFVPVTTRTIEQYRRITLFQNEVKPLYAITSNGGNVLRNGEVDESWNKNIRKRMEDESLSLVDILVRFDSLKSSTWIQNEKSAEDLFYYFIIDREKIPANDMRDFTIWMEQNNWNVSIQGRKLYFVPAVVNKRDAVIYVKEIENRTKVFASGDSLLDLPLVNFADHSIVPAHGEIHHFHQTAGTDKTIPFTSHTGILASEEILVWVIDALKKKEWDLKLC